MISWLPAPVSCWLAQAQLEAQERLARELQREEEQRAGRAAGAIAVAPGPSSATAQRSSATAMHAGAGVSSAAGAGARGDGERGGVVRGVAGGQRGAGGGLSEEDAQAIAAALQEDEDATAATAATAITAATAAGGRSRARTGAAAGGRRPEAEQEEEVEWEETDGAALMAAGFSAAEVAAMLSRARGDTFEDEHLARQRAARRGGGRGAATLGRGRGRRPDADSMLLDDGIPEIPLGSEDSEDDGGDGDASGGDASGSDYEGGEGMDMAALLALPEDLSSLDAEVLSTLPQSVQLEILDKMRDSQAAGGRLHCEGKRWTL